MAPKKSKKFQKFLDIFSKTTNNKKQVIMKEKKILLKSPKKKFLIFWANIVKSLIHFFKVYCRDESSCKYK